MDTTKDNGASRLDALGLAHLFHRGKKSWHAAELLLSGRQISRQELARQLDITPTTIPRVIHQLQSAGIKVDRTEDPSTQAATYQVSRLPREMALPRGALHLVPKARTGGPLVKLTKMEGSSKALTVTMKSPLGMITGVTSMHPLVHELADAGLPLHDVLLLPGGKQEWVLGGAPDTITVSDIAWM